MAKQITLDPVEGQVYSTPSGEHRRIIGVNSAMVKKTPTESVPEPVAKRKTWVTYSSGGDTNRRCQLKSFRKWIRDQSASVIHGQAPAQPQPQA